MTAWRRAIRPWPRHGPRWLAAAPRLLLATLAVLLTACASGPPPPDWQLNAHGAMDSAVAAYLRGDTRVANAEFDRARGELSRTGRADLLARAELLRCAAQVASLTGLKPTPCDGFEALRADAPAAERAYADYLGGALAPEDAGQLPPAQRPLADAKLDAAALPALLGAVRDPLSRLVAAGLALQTGRASPAVVALAVQTASDQGWRRPLLAWLGVVAQSAEQAGDAAAVALARRRIALVLETVPAAPASAPGAAASAPR